MKNLFNKKNIPQDKSARKIPSETLEKVQAEFSALTIGRQDLTTEEIFNLRKYAKAKTKLDTNEDLLTDEQLAWKVMYSTLNEQLEKILGAEDKKEQDKLVNEMDILIMYKPLLKEFLTLCKTINELFDRQTKYIQAHFNTSPYREKEKRYGELMVSPEQSNEEHLKYANLILELSKTYREELVKPLSEVTNQLQENILELEKQEQYFSINPDNRKLLDCFKEELFNNIVAVNHIKSSSDWDESGAKTVIQNHGREVSFPRSFVEQMAESFTLSKQAGLNLPILEAKRRGLTEKYVGKSL